MREAVSIWSRRVGFGRAPRVLVVDLARAFTESPRPLTNDASVVIAASNRLIGAARTCDAPVMFTTMSYERDDLGDAGLWSKKMKISRIYGLARAASLANRGFSAQQKIPFS